MPKIRHLQQGKNDFMCGQVCAAMVTGQDVQDIVEAVGTDDGTTGEEMTAVLRRFGVRCSGERRLFKSDPLPERAMLRVMGLNKDGTYDKRWGGHWILLWDGMIYDPDEPAPIGLAWYTAREMDSYSLKHRVFFYAAIKIHSTDRANTGAMRKAAKRK